VAALAADGRFVPALVLIRSLWITISSVLRQGDITIDEALMRIKNAPAEAKERGKEFVIALNSPPSPTSGSRVFLAGNWNYLIEKNPAEAVKWYRMAADQGYAHAQCNLGVCYDTGQGVAKDPVEAVRWMRKAAEQGHAGAQFNLGVCYQLGKGIDKDLVEAVKWMRKAAEQGYANA
jgi:hypothetical protein